MTKWIDCPTCDGEGEYLVDVPMRQSFTRDVGEYETEWETCEDCNGAKQIEEEEDE